MTRVINQLPPWFSISNYSEEHLSAEEIKNELIARFKAMSILSIEPDTSEIREWQNYIFHVQAERRPLGWSLGETSEEIERVISLMAEEVRSEQARINPLWPKLGLRGVQLLTPRKAREYVGEYEAYPGAPDWTDHNGSIPYDLILEDPMNPQISITLDLNLPDKLLLANVKHLLTEIRQHRKFTPDGSKTRKGDLDKIKAYRIIPFLDLEIWAKEQSVIISNQTILDGLGLDTKPFWTSEDVRKTARPLLKKCMDPSFINDL